MPLVKYTGLMIHSQTRQRGLICDHSSHGPCISFERTQEISITMENNVCAQVDRDGCVCPSRLRSYVFSAGAVDNIDYNPSVRNAMDSVHGTAISIHQFPPQGKPAIDFILINRHHVNKKNCVFTAQQNIQKYPQ